MRKTWNVFVNCNFLPNPHFIQAQGIKPFLVVLFSDKEPFYELLIKFDNRCDS